MLDGKTVALAHDWLVTLRGGEVVLDRLARLFGPAPLYCLVADGRPLTPAIDACRVYTSPLQWFPGAAGRARRWYLPLMPWAVGRLRVEPCDLLISTSSAVIKSIRPPEGTPHLCYCHSPARYIWEQTGDYAVGAHGAFRAAGLRAFGPFFRRWDRRTADRVTLFVANSRHTAARIERCFGRTAEVVHPPVRTDWYTPDPTISREDWYLVVSALEPYKRVDLAIEATRRMGRPLKIAGDGSQRDDLARRAGPGVELLGFVGDSELLGLYRRARAMLQPQLEDFGITAVEAQATGCPVIAYGAGGALETVTDQTGELFAEQTADSLCAAIERFEARHIAPDDCRQHAARFSPQAFDAGILALARSLASLA